MRSRKGSFARRSGRIPPGKVGKYSVAFINHSLWAKDNGRVVLGYDSRHGQHEHYTAAEEKFAFCRLREAGGCERSLNEVRRLRTKKEPV